ncbi:uncharacterized protein ASPGLDRAFT_55651 [Aspergillus glaucus CBS 516.65]|uniref:Uncharacterized protein n=1 Tax=Aspergillus glaucus CBS 516.65 TaxID=1160497 RepID=A0A1L9VTE2_ASPGL|nr:hypothetical protein ASPGLDRAFT_55651 [Aspergillus glaucus CBS 516.65]OJJ87170.1 hypothetical protein ASPGLDRAFT_55651 [Aspergillus glaucus CBS 516.65]
MPVTLTTANYAARKCTVSKSTAADKFLEPKSIDGTQKELEVKEGGNIHTVDFGKLAVHMTDMIEQNVVDPELRTWIMPLFSTTTDSDKVAASILIMGSLQKYFSCKISVCCGTPSITLLGNREDWEQLVAKTRQDSLTREGTHDFCPSSPPGIGTLRGHLRSPRRP